MAQLTYLEFDLLVERWQDQYKARVINSPAGQASSVFSLPFSEAALNDILLRLSQSRRRARNLHVPQGLSAAETSETEIAKAFGGRLYEAVFTEQMHGCLRASLDEANRSGAGLRIRLRLTETPELADLPWEYLYHSALNRFLSLSTQTPIVRYLDLPERIQPLAVQPPLKILVMISSPKDQQPLEVEREWEKLHEALHDLQRRKLVTLEKLEKATLPALQKLLRRTECHIFHFIGHGEFDQQSQNGVLIFEDEEEQGRPVSAQYLGTLLHDESTLRLAVLNACEGARSSPRDPFAGTVQTLVQQGIPAVIAMQFPITDEAAITFAHDFYSALADGYPVDAAVSEARKAIFSQGNEVEWGTPVLFMRAPDGRIFDMASVHDDDRNAKGEERGANGERQKAEIENRDKPNESPTVVQQSVTGAGGQVIQAGWDVVITQPQSEVDEKKDIGKRIALWLGIVATVITIITSIVQLAPDVVAPKSGRFFGEVKYKGTDKGVEGADIVVQSEMNGLIVGRDATGAKGAFDFTVKAKWEETVWVTVSLDDSVGFEGSLTLAGNQNIPFETFKKKP